MRWGGGDIPDLGVGIWDDTLALDYRPGTQWSSEVIARFVDLLGALVDLAPNEASLVVADESSTPLGKEEQERFRGAVEQYWAMTR